MAGSSGGSSGGKGSSGKGSYSGSSKGGAGSNYGKGGKDGYNAYKPGKGVTISQYLNGVSLSYQLRGVKSDYFNPKSLYQKMEKSFLSNYFASGFAGSGEKSACSQCGAGTPPGIKICPKCMTGMN
jgi:hypothetical protein